MAREVRLLGIWLWVQTAIAGEVVVPGFTPGTVGDFGPSERLTEATLNALAAADVPFVAPSEVTRRGGDAVVGCADRPECPETVFQTFPGASLVLVGSTTWSNGRLVSEMRFYGRGDSSPIEVLQASFRPEDSAEFAGEIAGIAEEILLFSPGAETSGPPVAKEPDSPTASPTSTDRPRDRLGDAPVLHPADEHGNSQTDAPMPRAWHGLPDQAQKRFIVSEMEWAAWRRDKAVRTGKVEVGVLAGLSLGDISRSYDVRIAIDEPAAGTFEEIGHYQSHDFIVDRGLGGDFYICFAPAWWIDIGLNAGIQTGKKQMTSGWQQYLDGDSVGSDLESHDPAVAVIGVVEPRLRLFLLPLGRVKPYLSSGFGLRFLDGYEAPDLADVEYPDLAAQMDLLMTVGGGLSIDLPMGLSLIIDVPWSYRLADAPLLYELEGEGLTDIPAPQDPTGQVLRFRGGIGVRL